MRLVQYVNCVSPHQIPLAREIAGRVGADQFRYLCLDRELSDRKAMGWSDEKDEWIVEATPENRKMLEDCDVLLTGVRDVALFQRRAAKGLKTYYQSERWFRPLHGLPGIFRLLSPGFCRMARQFVMWLKSDPNARCLAIGPWAMKDFKLIGVPEVKIVKWGYFVAPTTLKEDVRNRHASAPNAYPSKVLWVGEC